MRKATPKEIKVWQEVPTSELILNAWCVICQKFVSGVSLKASVEVGGWFCARHKRNELDEYVKKTHG